MLWCPVCWLIKVEQKTGEVSETEWGCKKWDMSDMEWGQTRESRRVLTLHEEGAQQLVCGHRFNLCSQVDVSSHHQRCSPEAQDPTQRTGHETQTMTAGHRHVRHNNNDAYTPVQVKSCHLCVVSVISSIWLSFHNIVSVVSEGRQSNSEKPSSLWSKQTVFFFVFLYDADLLGLNTTFCPPSRTSRALSWVPLNPTSARSILAELRAVSTAASSGVSSGYTSLGPTHWLAISHGDWRVWVRRAPRDRDRPASICKRWFTVCNDDILYITTWFVLPIYQYKHFRWKNVAWPCGMLWDPVDWPQILHLHPAGRS